MVKHLKRLTSKDKKDLAKAMQEQWGVDFPIKEFTIFKNTKGKFYILNKCPGEEALPKLRIDTLGLYIGQFHPEGFRLSVDGAQLVGKQATKNIITIGEAQMLEWIHGENILFEEEGYDRELVIVQTKEMILGCGKVMEGHIHPYIGKARRVRDAAD